MYNPSEFDEVFEEKVIEPPAGYNRPACFAPRVVHTPRAGFTHNQCKRAFDRANVYQTAHKTPYRNGELIGPVIDALLAAGYTNLKMTRPAHYGLFNAAGDYKEFHVLLEVEYTRLQLNIGNLEKNF